MAGGSFISALFHWKWEMELHTASWEISLRRDSRSAANAPYSWKETSCEKSCRTATKSTEWTMDGHSMELDTDMDKENEPMSCTT